MSFIRRNLIIFVRRATGRLGSDRIAKADVGEDLAKVVDPINRLRYSDV